MTNTEDYVRVTDVLFPFSGLKNIDPEVLKRAAARGSRVHEAIDAYIEGLGDFGGDPEIEGYMQSFFCWWPKQFIDKPERFYCDELMLTGECDGVYLDGEELVLVDFKTPAGEGKTWSLQGSAYSYLARQRGLKISRIEFVKLDKAGKSPKVFTYQENFPLFKSCLDVYRHFFKKGCEENPLDYL